MNPNSPNDNQERRVPGFDSSDVTIIEVAGQGDTTLRPIRPSILRSLKRASALGNQPSRENPEKEDPEKEAR